MEAVESYRQSTSKPPQYTLKGRVNVKLNGATTKVRAASLNASCGGGMLARPVNGLVPIKSAVPTIVERNPNGRIMKLSRTTSSTAVASVATCPAWTSAVADSNKTRNVELKAFIFTPCQLSVFGRFLKGNALSSHFEISAASDVSVGVRLSMISGHGTGDSP